MKLDFDSLASEFDTQRGLPRHALSAWMSLVEEIETKTMLEIVEPGIGTGRIALSMAIMGHQVTGADISRQMLAICESTADELGLGDQLTLVRASAVDLPLADASFDLGVVAQLLYLVPDWPTVLDELARIVKPGGYVIHLSEPTLENDALRQWSARWREIIESTGYRHIENVPTDDDVRTEFLRRLPDVQIRELAKWEFGQSVEDAMEDYAPRLRSLYESVLDSDWIFATNEFLKWADHAFPDRGVHLGGTVTLTALIALV